MSVQLIFPFLYKILFTSFHLMTQKLSYPHTHTHSNHKTHKILSSFNIPAFFTTYIFIYLSFIFFSSIPLIPYLFHTILININFLNIDYHCFITNIKHTPSYTHACKYIFLNMYMK